MKKNIRFEMHLHFRCPFSYILIWPFTTIIELDDTGVSYHEKLGYALVDLGYYDIPEHLVNYIDYEAIGRDYDLGISGEFVGEYYLEYYLEYI